MSANPAGNCPPPSISVTYCHVQLFSNLDMSWSSSSLNKCGGASGSKY